MKVALSGEGGDELFGGYYTYAADLLADRVAPLARVARPLVERCPRRRARRASTTGRSGSSAPRTCRRSSGITAGRRSSPPTRARELRGGANGFDPVDVYRARYAETAGAPELARLQDVDFGVYLVDDLLVKTDRASMAHSLEVRVPFLDPMVTNLAFALPTRLKVRGLQKKVLLRKAVEPLVPREIVHGKKRGFSIPAAAWLRGELEPFARATLSAETLTRQGFFRPEPVTRLLDEHVAGARGLEPAALGAARVHALVRAAGGAGAAAATIRPDGGARGMNVAPSVRARLPADGAAPRSSSTRCCAARRPRQPGLLEDYEAEGEEVDAPGSRCALLGYDDEPVAVVEVTEARHPARRGDGRAIRPRRGRGLRVGGRLARRARAVLRAADRA